MHARERYRTFQICKPRLFAPFVLLSCVFYGKRVLLVKIIPRLGRILINDSPSGTNDGREPRNDESACILCNPLDISILNTHQIHNDIDTVPGKKFLLCAFHSINLGDRIVQIQRARPPAINELSFGITRQLFCISSNLDRRVGLRRTGL